MPERRRAQPDTVDGSETEVPGPWRHRYVAAHGARFHVAEAGPQQGDPVVLLHGFPQFWWAWRHQLVALADAGHRVVAMDLRGYGTSDKPPRGYDTMTTAADVAGVVRSLGGRRAVVVGHDWGGWTAWSMPGLQPDVTRAVAVVSAAHPLALRRCLRDAGQRRALRPVLDAQVPVLPERALRSGTTVRDVLTRFSATPGFPDAAALDRYQRAVRVPFAAHTSLEYARWAVRSRYRSDGRRFAGAVSAPVQVPVLVVHGEQDRFVLPRTASPRPWAGGPVTEVLVPGAGHWLPEESPQALTDALLGWLADLPAPAS